MSGLAWGAPWGGGWGTGAGLPATANPLLDDPALRLIVEIGRGALPLTLPAFLGSGPLLVSTEDLYVPGLARPRIRPYAAQVLADNPSGYWRLGDLDGTQMRARVGLHGTYVNGPTLQTTGPLAGDTNGAVTFAAASSEYAWVPADSAWDVGATQALTLACWVKLAAAPASNRFVLVERNDGTGYYRLAIDTSGRVTFHLHGATGGEAGGHAIGNICNNAWHHVVVVRDVATATLRLYVDAMLRGAYADTTTGTICATQPLWVAAHGTSAVVDQYLTGALDEMALFRTALPAARIEAHYQAGRFNSQTFVAGRLVDVPALELATADLFGGLPQADQLTVRLRTHDPDSEEPDLSAWMARECRGWPVRGHLYDVTTGTLVEHAFVGQLAGIQQDLGTTTLLCTAGDPGRLVDTLPALVVATDWAPDAPALPAGGLGAVVPLGVGIGRSIDLPCVKGRAADEETLATITATAANVGTNTLTVDPLDLDLVATGDGPYTLVTTGTLPAPLVAGAPYWLIIVDATTLALAATPGDALADTPLAIALTAAGSGTHTLTTGRAAQRDPHYDYACSGNVGVVAVTVDDAPVLRAEHVISPAEGEDPGFTILHRAYRPDDVGLTTLRFADDVVGSRVRATVQRVYPDVDADVLGEWKWLHGGHDDVGGLHAVAGTALGASTAGTDDLCRGPNPLGFGAVALDGVDDYWQTAFHPGLLAQTFTVETWIYVTGTAAVATIAAGPGLPVDTFDVPAWYLQYNHTNQRVDAFFRIEPLTSTSVFGDNGSAPSGRWLQVALVVAPDHAWLYVNGALVGDDAKSAIVYPTPLDRGLVFGRRYDSTFTVPYALKGRLGYTRVSTVARTAREIADAYYRMRRNPIRAWRTLEAVAGTRIDETTADTATAAIDAVEGGALHADGWLTAPRALEQIRQEFVPFRDLRFGRTATGALTVAAATPAASVGLTLDVGAGHNNVVELATRVRASLAEAVRTLPVQFRLTGEGSLLLTRAVHSVGRIGDPLVLPWVDDIVTADIVGCFRAKRLRTRDERIDLTTTSEARAAVPGLLVRLTSIGNAIRGREYETVRVLRLPSRTGLTVVPYDALDFVYEPNAQLPPETQPVVLRTLDLGTTPSVLVTRDGNVLTLELADLQTETLRPVADGPVQQFGTIVGAARAWAAVAEASADGDTSYVEAAGSARLRVRCGVPTHPLARVRSITITVRAKALTSAVVTLFPMVGAVLSTGAALTTSYADYAVTWRYNPATGAPWTIGDLNALDIGVQLLGTTPVRVTQMFATYEATAPDPDLLGGVDWWRVGPSASQPATPASTDVRTTRGAGLVTTYQEGLASGTHWYWARPLDRRGRPVAVVGPGTVVV